MLPFIKKIKLHPNEAIILFIGLLLAFYTFRRAVILSFTHDESRIYLMMIAHSLSDIFNYRIISQDHMLNTFLMKISSMIFSDNEFILRLPNLIGHLLFIIFSYLMMKKFIHKYLLIAAFILINFNPYLLDFFSAARGYGLSVSMMLISIYFLLSYADNNKIKSLILSYIFATLSVFSVYSLLYYFIALFAWTIIFLVYKILIIKNYNKKIVLYILSVFCIVIIFSLVIYLKLHEPLKKITDKDFIYQTSSNAGFYSNTFRSVIYASSYNKYNGLLVTIASVVLGVFYISGIIYIIKGLIERRYEILKSPLFISMFILAASSLTVVLLYHISNVEFPHHRTSTLFMPLIILPIIFLLNIMHNQKYGRLPALIIIYFFTVILIINTFISFNFTHYSDWRYDSSTEKMLCVLEKEIEDNKHDRIKLGVNWIYSPAINFYRKTKNLGWLDKADRNGYENESYDYYYITLSDTNNAILKKSTVVDVYPLSESILLKRKAEQPH